MPSYDFLNQFEKISCCLKSYFIHTSLFESILFKPNDTLHINKRAPHAVPTLVCQGPSFYLNFLFKKMDLTPQIYLSELFPLPCKCTLSSWAPHVVQTLVCQEPSFYLHFKLKKGHNSKKKYIFQSYSPCHANAPCPD